MLNLLGRVRTPRGLPSLIGCAWGLISFVLFAACLIACAVSIFGLMRSSEPYQMAMDVLLDDPRAARALGEPIEAGFWVSGSIQQSNADGEANLIIPVSGSHDRGRLYVYALREEGVWRLRQLTLETENYADRIDLLGE